ncbi:MAG: outer membrane beta-barrel protein [Akkermansiaceae bacterium]
MTKTYIVAGSIALASLATAQSLFVEDPNEAQGESLPIQYTVSAGLGYDDYFTSSTESEGSSSIYANAALGANYMNSSPQTTWKVGAYLSANKYFEDDRGGAGIYYNARLNLDLNHRINERTRFVSRNYASFGIEPDYSFSFTPNKAPAEHLFYSSDNSIGHRWTSRLATYTGVRVSGLSNHGGSNEDDRTTYGIYNNFRYSLNQTTTLTANLSYAKTDADGSAGDATDIVGSLGIERRLSDRSYVTANAGVTHRDVDGGRDNYYSPYITAALNTSVNSRLRLQTFVRYGVENYGTSQGVNTYDTNQAIRVGLTANYAVSPKLSFNAGVNYIQYDYSDGRDVVANTAIGDADRSLVNPHIGFTYRVNDSTSVNGSYNYTDSSSSSSLSSDDFSRNRVQLGVSRIF